MSYTEQDRVRDTLSAIKSVKSRARKARDEGRMMDFQTLMGDLAALENCLVTESAILVHYDMEDVA